MPRYEYKNVILTPCDATAEWINKLEAEGWEVYNSVIVKIDGVFHTDFCLKRRRVEPRYEYKNVILSSSAKSAGKLNALEAEGWEVCMTSQMGPAHTDSYLEQLSLKRRLSDWHAINGVVFEHGT